MKMKGQAFAFLGVAFLATTIIGCATQAQTGALSGAGVGALIGQAIGRNTAGTLIGAGVGTGLGYIIGNELDKQETRQKQVAPAQELQPLAGTSWKVVSVVPAPANRFQSIRIHFRGDGTALTAKVDADGRLDEDVERFRVVGSTLIVNKDDYVINARFRVEGSRMFLDTGEHSVVLERY